jgi:cytochrome c553
MNIRLALVLSLIMPVVAGAATQEQKAFTQAMAAKPDAEHGAQLFQHCVECHGPDGGGVVTGSVPRIAGQHYSVLVQQVVQFRGGKHWDMRMEGVASSQGILSRPQDIADVAAYVNELSRDGKRGVGDGDYLDLGRTLYQGSCASCHGKNGEGNAEQGIPNLAGQHSAYLARQIYDAVDGRRPALTASHGRRLKVLTFEGVLGVTDYLSRIGWNPQAAPVENDRPGR